MDTILQYSQTSCHIAKSKTLKMLIRIPTCSVVAYQSFSHVWLCNPMGCSLPGSDVHGFSKQEYWSGVGCIPFPRGSSWPRDRTQVSFIAGNSLPSLSHQGSPCWHKHTYKCNKTVFRDTLVFVNIQKNVYNILESDNWFVWDRIVAGVEENTLYNGRMFYSYSKGFVSFSSN